VTHATLDLETYSEAGYVWNPAVSKWEAPAGAKRKGLAVVGSAVYAEHPTTDVLTLSYRLPGDPWPSRWRPGEAPPARLLAWIAAGGLVESHNAMFEWLIWTHVLVARYGFPPLPPFQQRCSMATARVNTYPGALGDLSDVLALPVPKDKEGKRLLDKFSVPRNPTKTDSRRRVFPPHLRGPAPPANPKLHATFAADDADFERLCAYCDTDVVAEDGASERMPPMSDAETLFWLVDQEINRRGMGVDRAAVRDCIAIMDQVLERYGERYRQITGLNPTQLEASRGWLAARGCHLYSMDQDAVEEALSRPGLDAVAREVLTIRQRTGSASVKKLYALENQTCADDRVRNLIVHHGARTGRPTGEGPQPLNLPKAGPALVSCAACAKPFRPTLEACPWCGGAAKPGKAKWSAAYVDDVLAVLAHRSLDLVEWYFGDAMLCLSGVLRGLFIAAPGHELIASDYTAIEAVVIAMLAGEEWRIDAFRRGLPIYLLSAAKVTGRTLEEYEAYAAANGEHHPDRQNIGKVAELGLGFGGWVNAWRAFDDSGTYSDDEIKRLILAWRDASPAIVEFWGGQHRGRPWDRDRRQEYFGVEGHAILALLCPGQAFVYRGITFQTRTMPTGDMALIIRLPSGRELTYHRACLSPSPRDPSEYAITYWTWNSNPKYGSLGWGPMATFGGRLVENIVQATAHDILRHAILQLRMAGYPTILHVYDEIICEIPEGSGSLEHFEQIMSDVPPWAQGWPVTASGGWRGRRYRKG